MGGYGMTTVGGISTMPSYGGISTMPSYSTGISTMPSYTTGLTGGYQNTVVGLGANGGAIGGQNTFVSGLNGYGSANHHWYLRIGSVHRFWRCIYHAFLHRRCIYHAFLHRFWRCIYHAFLLSRTSNRSKLYVLL